MSLLRQPGDEVSWALDASVWPFSLCLACLVPVHSLDACRRAATGSSALLFSTNDCHWIITICCITGGREVQNTKDLKSTEACDNVERVWFFAQQVKYGCVCVPEDFRHFLSLLNSFFFFSPKMSTYSFYIPTLQGKLMLCRNARLFLSPHLSLKSIAKQGQMKCAMKVLLFLC